MKTLTIAAAAFLAATAANAEPFSFSNISWRIKIGADGKSSTSAGSGQGY